MEEIFRPVVGFEQLYEVSNLGNVKSLRQKKMMKPRINRSGYPYVNLRTKNDPKTFMVHRLVAISFIENINNKKCVNHKNGIRNDNRVDNLEWVTHKENIIHAIQVLGKMKSSKNKREYKFDHIKIDEDYNLNCFLYICEDQKLYIGFKSTFRKKAKGFSLNKKTNKYTVLIRIKSKVYYIGEYDTTEKATDVYYKIVNYLLKKAGYL